MWFFFFYCLKLNMSQYFTIIELDIYFNLFYKKHKTKNKLISSHKFSAFTINCFLKMWFFKPHHVRFLKHSNIILNHSFGDINDYRDDIHWSGAPWGSHWLHHILTNISQRWRFLRLQVRPTPSTWRATWWTNWATTRRSSQKTTVSGSTNENLEYTEPWRNHLEPKRVLQSDAIEESVLVPQRTFQTRVL